MEFEIRSKVKVDLGLSELWEYRELFCFFTWRDIKVKYKQTILGVLWAVFQPIIMTVLFTLGFGKMLTSNTEINVPYPIFALSGFIMWNIFSTGLSNAGNSMVNNSNIIKKIYFPRLIIPISSILVAVIDFLMTFLVFIPVLLFYNCTLNLWAFVYIPLSVLFAVIATFGLGTLIAAINIKYRDFRYILPFFIQALLFATPVIYPIKITDNKLFQWILQINPMNAPIELFRASIENNVVNCQTVIISLIMSTLLFIVGVVYFRKTESYFADLA